MMSMAKILLSAMESGPHIGFNNFLLLIIYGSFFKAKEKKKIIAQRSGLSLLVLIPNIKTIILQERMGFLLTNSCG